jgi:tetratricopeptide (TPR) repeat protein
MDVPMRFARRSIELRRKVAERDKSFDARGALANALSAYGGLRRATGDLSGAVETFQESLAVLDQMAADNPNHYKTQLNIANTHALIARNLGDPNGPSLRQTDAAIEHFEESLRIGRRLMALDENENQVRFNHSLAAWRLGDALRGGNPRSALASYDEAVAILRTMAGNLFNRDIPLVASLAESSFALRALGRNSEAKARIDEAARICEPHRTQTAVYETCREFVSRAVAGLALAKGRPLDAVSAHREWLKVAEGDQTPERAKEDIYSAYVLTNHYHLLRESLLAAGLTAEADQADLKRRALVEVWKGKLSGRNDAEAFLR